MNPSYNTLENADFKSFWGFPYPDTKEQGNIFSNVISLYTYYSMYFNYFKKILYSLWSYKGLPEYIEKRNAEEPLIIFGSSVAFKNKDNLMDIMGYTATKYDRYYNPIILETKSPYDEDFNSQTLTDKDFIIVNNNTVRQPSSVYLYFLATRLANIEKQIDTNIKAIKNPRMWQVPEGQEQTIQQIVNDVNSDDVDILVSDKLQDIIKLNQAQSNYYADKLEELKFNVINDVLTMLGISNIGAVEKKERLISIEVEQNNIINNLNLNDMLECRKVGYEKVNKKFGTDISVSINPVLEIKDDFITDEDKDEEGEGNE